MSLFGDIGNFISNAASTVVHGAEDVLGGAAKVAIGVGEAGLQTIGDIVKNPAELLNPFEVISGAAKHLIGDVAGQFCGGGSQSAVGAAASAVAGATSGSGDASVLNAVDGLSNRVSSLEDQLSKLDPNSPTYAADSLKLQTQIQQAEQQMTELSTMLTNISKNKHDAVENFARNLA